jgi:hypothetical protein
VVPSATLLGLSISNDFKWNTCTYWECMQKSLISLILFETIETSQITVKWPPFVLCHLHPAGCW